MSELISPLEIYPTKLSTLCTFLTDLKHHILTVRFRLADLQHAPNNLPGLHAFFVCITTHAVDPAQLFCNNWN
jgi:hypothetical protein